MADDADKDSKTEQPSGRKLARGRQQGQVAQSREVNTAFMLLAGTAIVLFMSGPIANVLRRSMLAFLQWRNFLGPDGVRWPQVEDALAQVGVVLLLPLGVMVVAAVLGTVIQIGLLFATDKFSFDLTRLSPMNGIKRLFSVRSGIEVLKSIVKVALVGGIAAWMTAPALQQVPKLASEPLEYLPGQLYRLVIRLLLTVLVLVVVLAAADYAYARFSFMRMMRMTKQEVKEEFKQAEGDPKIKAKLRQIRVQRARQRMMANVPKASVVITNPTHYAVALMYELGESGAPKVVAKGTDLVALRIREIAEEHDVPIVENPPLARALYATVEVEQEVPPEHYKAVAEIISYVFRLKGKIRPQPRRAL